jgi:integrase
VNIRTNTLRLTTHKTKTDLYLPILPVFKTVLEKRLADREKNAVYVFPEAEKMLRENSDGITWRIKKAFALALGGIPEAVQPPDNHANLADALPNVIEAINAAPMKESKRKTLLDCVTRYAVGQSLRDIEKEMARPRSTISLALNEAQRLSGVHFIRYTARSGNGGIKAAIANVTRVKRKHGMKEASKYDFHCLRTTFVTLAISNGLSIDKLRALTGHATVEIVMRHYFKPKGTDFSDELAEVMPEALTVTTKPKQLPRARTWQMHEQNPRGTAVKHRQQPAIKTIKAITTRKGGAA